jgi:hypothetical protein
MITYSMQNGGVFANSMFSKMRPVFVQLPHRLLIFRTTSSGSGNLRERAERTQSWSRLIKIGLA